MFYNSAYVEKDVWNYCVAEDIKFCMRQHIHVWGTKKRKI